MLQDLRIAVIALLIALVTLTAGAGYAADKDSPSHAWPWTKLVRPEVPAVKNEQWVQNPIDAFILAKQEERGLEPAPPVSWRAALRRLSFGLVGLPPTPEAMAAFLANPSPETWAEQVETALKNPGYGERWGRHWLDLVRYADTRGGALDYPRPHMWRYRDYVIRAFNQDRPFDRFVREQVAGDAYTSYGDEAKLGLAFLHLWVPVERDSGQQNRRDFLADVVGTTGSAFLGLTLECAQCHDHKYDPIPTRDYYRLEAFFAPLLVEAKPVPFTQYELPNRRPELWEKQKTAWKALLKKRKEFADSKVAAFKDRVRKSRELRAPLDLKDLVSPVSDAELKRAMNLGVLFTKEERDLYGFIRRQTARFANPNSPDYYEPKAFVAVDSQLKSSVATYVLAGGDYAQRGQEVAPGFLTAAAGNSDAVSLEGVPYTRRRLLAEWITSPDNPLTARVMVNRIWQHHFGTGLVATPSDFGKNGGGTVHRELLDWLAWQFVDSGWSIKAIHRTILTSNVYRQSIRHPRSETFETVDPENRYLWVRDPIRIEAELIRDSVLASSGELSSLVGGPPFFPVVDDDVMRQAPTWWEPSDRENRNRRSVYMLQIRSLQFPMINVFNGPNIDQSCPVRNTNTTTPQVLALFNSEFSHEQSRFMAKRIENEVGEDPSARVERAFQLAFQRAASPTELAKCVGFLSPPGSDNSGPAGSLSDLCLVLLNTNEFIYLE